MSPQPDDLSAHRVRSNLRPEPQPEPQPEPAPAALVAAVDAMYTDVIEDRQ